MILSIDALRLPLTGIGWYTLELAKGMLDHPDVDSLQFTDGRRFPLELPNLEALEQGVISSSGVVSGRNPEIHSPIPALRVLRGVWGRGRGMFCRRLLERAIDHVCHGPNYIVPRRSPKSMNTATIHDLSILRYPQLHPARRVAHMISQMPQTIECCERLIVSSRAVAHEVSDEFDISMDRIAVVPLGVRRVFNGQASFADAGYWNDAGVTPGRFFLFVNGSDPRKNLDAALLALHAFRHEVAGDMKLVVTVPPDALDRLKSTLTLEPGVVLLSYPEEAHLAALYRGAAGLLFPSLYEGFGLPVIEALASGTPVLISQAETLLEFSELPGVVVVDVNDRDAFCQGLIELGTADLAGGAERGANSIAERFAWRHCVNRTLASYAALS